MPKDKSEKFHFSPRPNRAHEIDWMEWGGEAFRRSKAENKPVLMAISAVWCHWCHVMDETTYSDGQVIHLLNEKFIPVRVDSDRRPDLNSRYNQGGWPTTALLTDEGEIIAGTTFIAADRFGRLLADVYDLYTKNAADIDAAVQLMRKRRAEEPPLAEGGFDESMIDFVVNVASQAFDGEFGGFGIEPKFPYVSVLSLLLARLAADAPGNMGEIVRVTLENMAQGGINDQVQGGFFRYATNQDWSIPHYEKLLEDNAALMGVYTEAYNLSGDADYAKTVYGIQRYLSSVLLDPSTGAFAGSQDADEEYYKLGEEERGKRPAPYIDRTVFAGANALAASALFRAFQVFGDGEFRSQATAALEFIWGNMWDVREGLYHFYDGERRVPGLLTDMARLAAACLDAYESGMGEAWLDRAVIAANWMLTRLQDPGSGAFFDSAHPPGEQGYPIEPSRPPVDNSIAATVLIRMAQNTGQTKFDDAAQKTLKHFAGVFQEYGLFAAEYALALARLLDPPVRVTVTGPPAEATTVDMIRAAHRARIPFRSIEVIDPETYGEDLQEAGYGYEGMPVAYICIGASCQPAVVDPAELPARLETGWSAISRQQKTA